MSRRTLSSLASRYSLRSLWLKTQLPNLVRGRRGSVPGESQVSLNKGEEKLKRNSEEVLLSRIIIHINICTV